MPSTNKIQFIERNSIDLLKWDDCINSASNGLIYAKSQYLDVMCNNWSALVCNDYEHVMPIPWRKKWGFSYIYPPYFIAALGIFGDNLTLAIVQSFIRQIPKKYKYWEMDLNEMNKVEDFPTLQVSYRKNYFLSLDKPYEVLYKNYSRLAKRKLVLAVEKDLQVHHNVDPQIVIQAYQEHYEEKNRIIPPKVYNQLNILFGLLQKENYRTYLVKKNDQTIAFYLVLNDKQNVYSLIGGSTEEGKQTGAFYMATDAAIKEFSNSDKTFRFEGSDKEGIAFFNSQFGSVETEYLRIKMNNLPWPLNYLK
jgi:hypothetical protein